MIKGVKYDFSLGAHVTNDVMSTWSCTHVVLVLVLADVYQLVMGICQA